MSPLALEQYLRDKIPLAGAMQIRVIRSDAAAVVVRAPLEPNHNHLGTAFGGSLGAVATLAAYGLLLLLVQEAEVAAQLVVRDSRLRYRAPVRGDFSASCQRPPKPQVDRFLSDLHAFGKGRLQLEATVEEPGMPVAVSFTGSFVALRES